jgi:phage baseplate assembly protein gpV
MFRVVGYRKNLVLKLVKEWLASQFLVAIMPVLFDDGYKTGGLSAQLRNIIRIGTVVARQNKYGAAVQATWQDKGINGVTSGFMPVLQRSSHGCKTFLTPRAGDQVISIHDPDAPEVGFVIGTLSTTSGPLNGDQNGPALVPQSIDSDARIYNDKVVMDYDDSTSTLIVSGPIKKINITGISGPAVIESSSTLSLKFSSAVVDAPIEFKQAVTMDQTCLIKSTLTVQGATTVQDISIAGTETGGGSI